MHIMLEYKNKHLTCEYNMIHCNNKFPIQVCKSYHKLETFCTKSYLFDKSCFGDVVCDWVRGHVEEEEVCLLSG